MTKRQFSNTEVEYLRALPAVESVTGNRITYSRDFQISCMRRYLDGERPSTIFTSAGLSPAIIGRKRVERNIARWKVDLDIMAAARSNSTTGALSSDTRERLVTVQLGQIRSLTCQVLALKERVDALERKLVNLAYSCCRTESLKFPLLLPSVLLARADIGRFIASLQTVVRASSYSGRGSWD